MTNIYLTGSFDDFRSRDIRILHEASRLGALHYQLWSDALVIDLDWQGSQVPAQGALRMWCRPCASSSGL